MKLYELKKLIREEAKRALNESSTPDMSIFNKRDLSIIQQETIAAVKKLADVSKSLMVQHERETEPLKKALRSLKSKYDLVITNSATNDIKNVEIQVKKRLPGAKLEIVKNRGETGIKINITSIKNFDTEKYQNEIRDIWFYAAKDAGIPMVHQAMEARDVYYRKLKTNAMNNNPLVSGYDTGYMKYLKPDSRKYDEPGKFSSSIDFEQERFAPIIMELTIYFTDKYKKLKLKVPDFIQFLSDNLKYDEFKIAKDALT